MTSLDESAHPGSRADQLEGFRIGVTSDRRSADLIAAFTRRGAEVVHAPTIKMVVVEDDRHLEDETRAIIAQRPALLLVTSSYGVRHWIEAAEAAGLGPVLIETLGQSRLLVRGPKAKGAIHSLGLDAAGMSASETTHALVDLALGDGVRGLTVAVQLHGAADVAQLERLRSAGATVLTVSPYRWVDNDQERVARLVHEIITGGVDVVTFTSAPAAEALLRAAELTGHSDEVLSAFRARGRLPAVDAAAVGPITAQPLLDAGITPLVPARFRMGALVKIVCDHLANQRIVGIDTVAGHVVLRGRLVQVGDAQAWLSPTSLALFRALVDAQGSTVTRDRLAQVVAEPLNGHGVDAAISRLRQTLPDAALVTTVVKRGYRLAV